MFGEEGSGRQGRDRRRGGRGGEGRGGRRGSAANNPLAPQAVADNFKAWVAVVVIREGGVPVTEKYPVGWAQTYRDSTIK